MWPPRWQKYLLGPRRPRTPGGKNTNVYNSTQELEALGLPERVRPTMKIPTVSGKPERVEGSSLCVPR